MLRKVLLPATLALLLCTGLTAAAQEQVEDLETDAASADVVETLNQTRQELRNANRRISELEQKIGAIEGRITETSDDVYSLSTQVKKLEAASREISPLPDWGFDPYGYIKIDAVYDSTRTSGTSATAFVLPEKPGYSNDSHYTITARQTRFGVNIAGPDFGEQDLDDAIMAYANRARRFGDVNSQSTGS